MVHHDRPYLFILIYLICFASQARAVVDYLPSPYDRDALRFSKEILRKIIFVYFLHVTLTQKKL